MDFIFVRIQIKKDLLQIQKQPELVHDQLFFWQILF